MFAKHTDSKQLALRVVLVGFISITLAESNRKHNNADVLTLNGLRPTGPIYYEPHAKYLHHQDGVQEGEFYNRRTSNNQDSSEQHPSYDSIEYPSYANPALTEENQMPNQHRHQHEATSLPTFSETMLSENITTSSSYFSTASASSPSALANYEQNGYDLNDRLLLNSDFIKETCRLDRGSLRSEQLNNTYLTHCSRYKLENLLSNEILMSIMHQDSADCERILDEFVQLDDTINQFDVLFVNLLSRYNCHNGYSVKWNCDDCKKAYKDWLCSSHLPYHMNGERIKPCISFCERVEQRCPYLHPITREQYGGQPVFICRDPNIPFVPEITPDTPYSEPGKCYDLCHLSDNLTELIIDSLSRYDYDKCPDRGSIAGEVRAELANFTDDSKYLLTSTPKSSDDYHDQFEENAVILANRTNLEGQTKVLMSHTEHKRVHVHMKKLEELREVLANYRNQAKTHRYHADHSSIDHLKSQHDVHSS